MSNARFRVGIDQTHRLYFVRDGATGRCIGYFDSPAQAFSAAKRCERQGALRQRGRCV